MKKTARQNRIFPNAKHQEETTTTTKKMFSFLEENGNIPGPAMVMV
jgi:hypothetical protein